MPIQRRNSFSGFNNLARVVDDAPSQIAPCPIPNGNGTRIPVRGNPGDRSPEQKAALASIYFRRRRSSVQLPIKFAEYSKSHPDFCRNDKVTIISNTTWQQSPNPFDAPNQWDMWQKRDFPWMGPLGRHVRKSLDFSKRLIFRHILRKSSYNPLAKDFRALTKSCVQCSQRRTPPPLALCGHCRHMRLPHFLFCGIMPIDSELWTIITTDTTRPECPFCQLITHIARNTLSDTQDHDGMLELHIRSLMKMLPFWPIISLYLENEDSCGSSCIAFFSEQSNTRILEVPFSTLGLLQQEYHSLVGIEINWRNIRSQLARCIQSHPNCQNPPSRSLPRNFYLIDVWNEQLVLADSGMDFIALSYVWGDNPDPSKIQAERLTLSSLRQPGGLRMDIVSKTIVDAMQCCLFLGQRYLWADRLCIIQDDPEILAAQIDAMDAVFSTALLVLIDASGTDMDSGLAGISRKRHHAPNQKAFHIPGLGILSNTLPSIEGTLLESKSKWMSRGWTYQEAALARRKLFFTTSQVYLVCETACHTEDGTVRYPDDDDIRLRMGSSFEDHYFSYGVHLSAYTKRSLRYQSDICNAFVGIVHALYPTPDSSMFSMPRPSFNRALLWYPYADCPEIRSTFPSWAWPSVAAQILHTEVTQIYGLSGNDFCGALVRWFEHRQCEGGSLFQAIEAHEEGNEFWKHWSMPGMALAWSLQCIESPPPLEGVEMHRQSQLRWPQYRDFFVEAFSGGDCTSSSITVDGAPCPALVNCAISLNDHTNGSLLFGRAQKASFNICYRLPDPCKLHTICCNYQSAFCFIMDDRGSRVGVLYSGEHKARVPNQPFNSNRCTRRLTFIALSISYQSRNVFSIQQWCTCKGCHLDKRRGKFKRELDTKYNEPVVDVLMIEKRGDFFYRLNLGFIVLGAWVEADRSFEDIVLA